MTNFTPGIRLACTDEDVAQREAAILRTYGCRVRVFQRVCRAATFVVVVHVVVVLGAKEAR